MNPLELIRERPDAVRAMLDVRHFDAPLDRIVELDKRTRALRAEVEQLRAERNKASKGGPPSEAVKIRMREVGERIKAIEAELGPLEAERDELVLHVPNMVDPAVPVGTAYEDNTVVREDPKRALPFTARPHWEIGEQLGILDIPRGAKVSGSRFYLLRGAGAALQRALIAWMVDLKIDAGFTEIYPPFLTKRQTLVASSHLPHFAENQYHDEQDDLWLIPTAEPQLVGIHGDEILDGRKFPLHYVAYTACFRREHMSAGRDVRGIKRVKQFYKVEMVRVVEPEHSMRHLEELVRDAEEILRRLELPYQVMLLCTGDLSFAMTKTYDLNVWSAGSQEWQEVASISNANDYQARRANIRFRREAGGKTEFPHTLNGSGVALPRTMIAILENNQQPDGSVVVPRVLRPYMGGLERIDPLR